MLLKKIKTDFFVIVDIATPIRMNDSYLDDVGSIRKCIVEDSRYWEERTQYKRINYSTSPLSNCKEINLGEVLALTKYNYTEQDMKKAFFGGGDMKSIEEFNHFIQNLQPTEWEVEIVDGKIKMK